MDQIPPDPPSPADRRDPLSPADRLDSLSPADRLDSLSRAVASAEEDPADDESDHEAAVWIGVQSCAVGTQSSGTGSPLLLFPKQPPGRNDINCRAPRQTEEQMLYWALMFLIIALIAGLLGFGGIAFAAAGIAKILFFIFLVVFVVMLLTGLMGRRTPPI